MGRWSPAGGIRPCSSDSKTDSAGGMKRKRAVDDDFSETEFRFAKSLHLCNKDVDNVSPPTSKPAPSIAAPVKSSNGGGPCNCGHKRKRAVDDNIAGNLNSSSSKAAPLKSSNDGVLEEVEELEVESSHGNCWVSVAQKKPIIKINFTTLPIAASS